MCIRCDCSHNPDLGACVTFEEGMNGRCVFCDHDKECHPGDASIHNRPLGVDFFNVNKPIAQAYRDSLLTHIRYVQEAGRMIGVSEQQLEMHDRSKWTHEEFPGYAYHFHGGGAPDKFAKAWLHHIHNNPHHWQHWIFPDNYTPKDSKVENGVVEMPQHFALEMIADWMGASKAYTGDWDMKDWLTKNMSKIRVHSRTAQFLCETLDHLGYADIVWGQEFRK